MKNTLDTVKGVSMNKRILATKRTKNNFTKEELQSQLMWNAGLIGADLLLLLSALMLPVDALTVITTSAISVSLVLLALETVALRKSILYGFYFAGQLTNLIEVLRVIGQLSTLLALGLLLWHISWIPATIFIMLVLAGLVIAGLYPNYRDHIEELSK